MSEKYVNPLSESQPAVWLGDDEELYLPEINEEGSLISRRASKNGKPTPDNSGMTRRRSKSTSEGLEWEEFGEIYTGGSMLGSSEIGVHKSNIFRTYGEEQDALDEELEDMEDENGNYVSPETIKNIALIAEPMPEKNEIAEAEIAKCGRRLVGEDDKKHIVNDEAKVKTVGH